MSRCQNCPAADNNACAEMVVPLELNVVRRPNGYQVFHILSISRRYATGNQHLKLIICVPTKRSSSTVHKRNKLERQPELNKLETFHGKLTLIEFKQIHSITFIRATAQTTYILNMYILLPLLFAFLFFVI